MRWNPSLCANHRFVQIIALCKCVVGTTLRDFQIPVFAITFFPDLMTRDYLDLNLTTLAKRYPFLVDRIKAASDAASIEISASGTGEPTASVVLSEGSQKLLHSRRDPRREVRRWAESFDVGASKTVALFGVGLGYPVEEFLRAHQNRIGGIWCFESSIEVFREMLSWKDWRWLIEEPRVHFFVGVSEDEFRALTAGRFQEVIVDGIDIVEYPPSIPLDTVWYRERQENLRDLMRQWTAEMLTVMERGKLFLANTLHNFRNLSRGSSYLLRDIAQVLHERPAILVSAGPSLDKNAGLLGRAKGKVPIVAVDTALRVLQKHGVQPDLVVSIDALGASKRHFDGVLGLEEVPVVYDLEVTPDVITGYPGPRFLAGNVKPFLYGWLEKVTGKLEGLTKGLTVAQAAFLMLAHYGVRPIILVGQDLSFEREGGKTHADGVAFQGRYQPSRQGSGVGLWEDPLNPRGLEEVPILEVPANDGGTVPTTHTLFAYLKRLESDIAIAGAEVVNSTEGGAFIRGTRVIPLREILESLLSSGDREFPGFVLSTGVETIGQRYGEGLEGMRVQMLALLEEGRTVCEEGFQKSDKLWRDLGWKNLSEMEIQKKFEAVSQSFAWIRNNKRIQVLIDRGVMRALYMLHKGDLPLPEERKPEHHRAVVERYRTFFADALDTISNGLKILK